MPPYQVQIARSATAHLDYRGGYFASKALRKFSSSDRERQLQEALMLGDCHRSFARGRDQGALQGTVRDEITVKLKGEDAGKLGSRNLSYDTGSR
jgi:hypothetical protein